MYVSTITNPNTKCAIKSWAKYPNGFTCSLWERLTMMGQLIMPTSPAMAQKTSPDSRLTLYQFKPSHTSNRYSSANSPPMA